MGALLLPQCSCITAHATAEILARFRTGQRILDFGGVLRSFFSDLAFGQVLQGNFFSTAAICSCSFSNEVSR